MSTSLGTLMNAEMAQQPAVLGQLSERLDEFAARIRAAAPRPAGVAFLARGSSDNAALLGRYQVELAAGLPTCLIAPSATTAYHRDPSGFDNWIVVAVSQSGKTPEIVHTAARFASCGAIVVAITNDAVSDLATLADVSIDLQAGPELAVPATKTVTAQMLAMSAVSRSVADIASRLAETDELAEAVAATLDDITPVREAAQRLARFDRLAVVARGLLLAGAKETALKLQETTGVMAHGFSTADFRHGPIAVCGPDAPAVLFAGSGPADQDTYSVRSDLSNREALTILIGSNAGFDVPLHSGDGSLECIVATIRGQQLAFQTCLERGINPDTPEGLNKITLTH